MSEREDSPRNGEVADALRAFVVDSRSGDCEYLSDQDLQAVLTAAVRIFATRVQRDPALVPLIKEEMNATMVGDVCLRMLDVVDLELFELTLWGAIGRDGSAEGGSR